MSRFILVLTVAVNFGTALPGMCRDKGDHLARLNTKEFRRYRQILGSHLAATPFDCGRVMVRPAFEPEYSISIYNSSGSAERTAYRITYLSAKESIWGLTNGGNDLTEAKAIKVRRVDADIPQSVAELLKDVSTKMLRRARGQTPPPVGEWQTLPIDTTDVEWALELPHGGALSGQLNKYFPIGPNTQSFLALTTETLLQYCKANPKERDAIARRIETSARKLLAAVGQD